MLLALPLLLSLAADGAEAPARLVGEAVQASDAGRYCDAVPLFLEIHRRSGSLRALFNAAEVAFAAGDRVIALDLYRRVESSPGFATFDKRALVRQRIDTVFRETQRAGPGSACPVPAARCGDWILQQGEQCDDGNATSGDGCDATCVPSACGNGVRAPDEACDDGNAIDGDGCDRGCVVSACGNGVLAPGEGCDDGNRNDGDGCDSNCTPTACGNGVRGATEQCDDGNALDGDGCDRGCVVTRCGNGVATAGERCDDGNAVGGDGCEADCTPSRVAAPLPGLAVAGAGAAALVTAGVLVAVGLPPWLEHEAAAAKLAEGRLDYPDRPEAALDDIDRLRETEQASRDAWTSYGLFSVGAASVLGGAGLLATAAGVWLALSLTDETDIADSSTAATEAP